MNPKISIIMPNYNSKDYIVSTLKSVVNQKFRRWELIIVDDNSDTKTTDILKNIKNYKNFKLFFLKKKEVQLIVETSL